MNAAEVVMFKGKGLIGMEPNELSAPIDVLIELTGACNLKCMHCMANADYCSERDDSSEIQTEGELSTDELKRLIDELVEIGVVNIDLSGGEPLLRQDFFEVAEYAIGKGLNCCLLTNALKIDEEMAKRLKEVGIYKIETNLDGPNAEIYDKFRGVPGSFDLTVRAIKAIKAQNIPLRINIAFCKMLLPYYEEIIDLAVELGAIEVCLAPLRLAGRVFDFSDELWFTPTEYASALSQVMQLNKKTKAKHGDSLILIFQGNDELIPIVNPANSFAACGAGRLHCTVTPTGKVKPCPAFPDDEIFMAGDLRKQTLKAIWDASPVFQDMRNTNIPVCDTCNEEGCMGGCRIQSYWVHKGLLAGPDPFCNKAIKKEIRKVMKGQEETCLS